jgi:hypothetical protein
MLADLMFWINFFPRFLMSWLSQVDAYLDQHLMHDLWRKPAMTQTDHNNSEGAFSEQRSAHERKETRQDSGEIYIPPSFIYGHVIFLCVLRYWVFLDSQAADEISTKHAYLSNVSFIVEEPS